MGYLVEKKGVLGFAYHPMNKIQEWNLKANEIDAQTAKKKAIELSKKQKGTYRVKDVYNGDILFKINS